MKQRPSARLIVLNPEKRVLLFHFIFDEGAPSGKDYWATPGGALQAGESYEQAARRELFERTGIRAAVGEEVAQRDVVYRTPDGSRVNADERFFLVKVPDSLVLVEGQEAFESNVMKTFRWWSLQELRETSERVYPENLADLVERLIAESGS